MALIVLRLSTSGEGRGNVPVMYPGRRVGNRSVHAREGHPAIDGDTAGIDPLDFRPIPADIPGYTASFFVNSSAAWLADLSLSIRNTFDGSGTAYWTLYFLMVVGFTFFYTDVLFAQQNYGENLEQAGAQIPGVGRETSTQRYLTRVLRRITFPGALFSGSVGHYPLPCQPFPANPGGGV